MSFALPKRTSHLRYAAAGDVKSLKVLIIAKQLCCLFVGELRVLEAVYRRYDLNIGVGFANEPLELVFAELHVEVIVLRGDCAGNHRNSALSAEE